MKKASLAVLAVLASMSVTAFAQTTTTSTGVMMSTDPARIADVEQRAQAIQAGQSPTGTPTTGMHRRSHPMMHHGMGHHAGMAHGASAATGK